MFSQTNIEKIAGRVTFISIQKIYVGFESTIGINIGDTLFTEVNKKLLPVIRVVQTSSKSVSGEYISDIKLAMNQAVIAFVKKEVEVSEKILPDSSSIDSLNATKMRFSTQILKSEKRITTQSRGRFSLQSYTGLNNEFSNYSFQRWRYSFSYYSDALMDKKLIFNNYMTYSYKNSDPDKFRLSSNKHLRIYDLSFKYLINEKSSVTVGRFIDNAVSNIGAVDGALYKHKFSFFEGGIIAGRRPIWDNNSTTNILPQFGFFLSRNDSMNGSFTSNSFALFQQMYKTSIDRRFVYFQHFNDFIPLTQINFSSEVDFFSMNKGIRKSELSLTSFYFSARISVSKMLTFNASYDARKNIVYLESYKSFIDSLYENEIRQGLRLGTTVRPVRDVYVGLNFGHRFMGGDTKSSSNYNGYVTWSQVPYFLGSASLNFSRLLNSFSSGNIISARFSKPFFDGRLTTSIYASNTAWTLSTNNISISQNLFGFDITQQLFGKSFLSLNAEMINSERNINYRFFVEINTRF